MANPSKKKGTGGENEVLALADHIWGEAMFERTSPGTPWDVYKPGWKGEPVNILATRPDHGQWLATMPLGEVLSLLWYAAGPREIRIEVKRYARFSLHTIWNKKFGGKA